MGKWFDIGAATDFVAGSRAMIEVEDKPIVVFNLEDGLRAIANVCPHAGLPLGDGAMEGSVLICPFHGYTFDVRTGRNVDFPDIEPPLRMYPLRTTDAGRVEIDLDPVPD